MMGGFGGGMGCKGRFGSWVVLACLGATILFGNFVPAVVGAIWHDERIDPVWQWSVPAPTNPDRRAFLWIAPQTQHIRGIVIGLQNMLEESLFQRAAFRKPCAETLHPDRSYLDSCLNPAGPNSEGKPKLASEDLQHVLDRLASESGYPEIAQAPLLPVGHSSAGPFVWRLYKWDPGRIFAMMPFKTGLRDAHRRGIPQGDHRVAHPRSHQRGPAG
jgi:hypothetical protein